MSNMAKQFPPKAKCEIHDVYILSASRTPTTKFGGSFLSIPAPKLGAIAIKSALEKSKVPAERISDVYMGNVLSGGVGQSPAKQASLLAGLPSSTEAVTVNKVCASGLKAVVLASQNIKLGLAEAQIAGGMENMSRVPYYASRGSGMPSFGHVQLEDGILRDGLFDAYSPLLMGQCAEGTAEKHKITRTEQDAYARQSYERARHAWNTGKFQDEVTAVIVDGPKGNKKVVSVDEGFLDANLARLPDLKPAFAPNGTITAGSSSTINDGASALVLCNSNIVRRYCRDSRVLSRICGYADAGVDPVDFAVAPASAVKLALQRASIGKDDVAIWEFNEAFAVVIKANEKILGLENARVNSLGGAISLGHALGNSGSRILVTLVHQLMPGEYGVAAVCNGGGGATAVVVQRVDHVGDAHYRASL
ncbi:Thiolase, N-terminal domain-containing protein [Cadophora sp. MPI-SDFR-AT-0126]|nr:Thiolase, N-terminal domain-containing protein [Leotiomycetes sp. MPI-SDFR-AT-0126]